MRQLMGATSFLLVLLAGGFACVNVLAQPQPVFLRLKGVGLGDIPGYGTGVQVAGDHMYLTWAGDTNRPGFVLQRSTSLIDPHWSDVPGSADLNGIELPLNSGSEFFRFARPRRGDRFSNATNQRTQTK